MITFQEMLSYFSASSAEYIKFSDIYNWFSDYGYDKKIFIHEVNLDVNIATGYMRRLRRNRPLTNSDDDIFRIVVSNQLNGCELRFVLTKELMHIFDTQESYASTHKDLINSGKGVLSQARNIISGPKPEHMINISPSQNLTSQVAADKNAYLKSLTILAPLTKVNPLRDDYNKLRADGKDADKHLAFRLKIPKAYVRIALSDEYLNAYSDYINGEEHANDFFMGYK